MSFTPEQNKAIVVRFNKEFIEQGNLESFKALVSEDLCNHTAPEGMPKGPDGMISFIQNILHKGFPGLKVEILEQVAEKDIVTTRKKISATHTGEIMGIPPSGKHVEINIMDMVRLRDGKYVEHWGMSNFPEVIARLAGK